MNFSLAHVRYAATLFAVIWLSVTPVSSVHAETTTKAPPACVEQKISHGDLLPCNSCALEKDVRNANYPNPSSLAFILRNSTDPLGFTESTNSSGDVAIYMALQNQAKPQDIKICIARDGLGVAIEFRDNLGLHGIVTDSGLTVLGNW